MNIGYPSIAFRASPIAAAEAANQLAANVDQTLNVKVEPEKIAILFEMSGSTFTYIREKTTGLAELIMLGDVNEAVLKSFTDFRSIVRAFLRNRYGVIINTIRHTDDVEFIPDGGTAAHALLTGGILLVGRQIPREFIVIAAVGIADDDINQLRSCHGERLTIAAFHCSDFREIGDLLAIIVLHEPQGRIDVTGIGSGAKNCP